MTLRLTRPLLCALVAFAMGARAQTAAPVWTNMYDGPADGYDDAYGMALDKNGHVFVTGVSSGTNGYFHATTIAYANSGTALWTNDCFSPTNGTADANAVAADGNGNAVVTGFSDDTNGVSYLTAAYSLSGTPLWTNFYAPLVSSNVAMANAIAIDSTGNVFITGYSTATNRLANYATLAYSAAGVPLWTNLYAGPVGGDSYARAIAIGTNGNVLVTGFSRDTNGGYEYATIAYSNGGAPLWTNRYSRSVNGDDEASAIAVDSNGNVFVTGKSTGLSGNSDYATVAYSAAGTPLWTNRYTAPVFGNSVATALAVSANGNVFVTGNSAGNSGWDDYATVAYSTAGVPLWTNRYDGPAGAYDDASGIAVDGLGHVFVTGKSLNAGFYDYATIAYSRDGVPLVTNRFDGPAQRDDIPVALALDQNGNVFVTGYASVPDTNYVSGTAYDYATIKYASLIPQPAPLQLQMAGQELVVSWTNASFVLQCAPALEGPYTNVSGATSPYTNSLSASQAFFRLIAQ